LRDLFHLTRLDILVSNPHKTQRLFRIAARDQLVQRRHCLARSHFAGIHRVIPEFLFGQGAVLIPDLAVLPHTVRIELHLDFHILGDQVKGGAQFIHEDPARLVFGIDKPIDAVSLVGELLQ